MPQVAKLFVAPFLMAISPLLWWSCAQKPMKATLSNSSDESPTKKEVKTLNSFFVTSEDGKWKANILAKDSPFLDSSYKEHFYYLQIPIGTETPVECYLYPEEKNLAQSALLFHQNFPQLAGDEKIHKKGIYQLKTGLLENRPFIDIQYIYDQNKNFFMTKYLAVLLEENFLYCFHGESGHKDLFLESVSSLVRSLKIDQKELMDPDLQLRLRELYTLRTGTQTIGVQEKVLYQHSGGKKIMRVIDSHIYPISSIDFSAGDLVITLQIDELNKILWANYNNGGDLDLTLKVVNLNKYEVVGKIKDKKVSFFIPILNGIDSNLMPEYDILRDLNSSSPHLDKTYSFYNPALNPNEIEKVRYKFREQTQEGRFIYERSSKYYKSQLVFNPNKTEIQEVISFPQQPELVVEKKYQEGELP